MFQEQTASPGAPVLRQRVSHRLHTCAIFLPPFPCQLRHPQMWYHSSFWVFLSTSHLFVNFPHRITEICRNIPDKFLMPLPPIIHNIIFFFSRNVHDIQLRRHQPVVSHCSSYTCRGEKNSALQLIGSSPCIFKKGCKMVKLAFKKSSRHFFNGLSELRCSAHSLSLSLALISSPAKLKS